MKYRLKLINSVLLAVISISASCNKAAPKTSTPPPSRVLDYVSSVTFLRASGEVISSVDVAVAESPEERSEGLMDVRELPRDSGMIFLFPKEEPLCFWMANTPLPLDIIFVNADSSIVRIHHNTQPFSEGQLLSEKPAQYVVEVNAGYCISKDIKEGDRIRF